MDRLPWCSLVAQRARHYVKLHDVVAAAAVSKVPLVVVSAHQGSSSSGGYAHRSEGHHLGWGHWLPASSIDDWDIEATASCVRQTHDLLSAFDAHVGGASRCADHHYSA